MGAFLKWLGDRAYDFRLDVIANYLYAAARRRGAKMEWK